MNKRIWTALHNIIAHPVMGFMEILPFQKTSDWGYEFHDWTAKFFPHSPHEELDPEDPEVKMYEALEGIKINCEVIFAELGPDEFEVSILPFLTGLEETLSFFVENDLPDQEDEEYIRNLVAEVQNDIEEGKTYFNDEVERLLGDAVDVVELDYDIFLKDPTAVQVEGSNKTILLVDKKTGEVRGTLGHVTNALEN